jgi:preprotein translocase subunit SecE
MNKPSLRSNGALMFLIEARSELEKVVWPTREQTFRLTIMVIAVTLAVGFFVAGIDFVFAGMAQKLIQ